MWPRADNPWPKPRPALLTVAALLAFLPDEREASDDPLLVDDAASLRELEDEGLAFERVVGRSHLEVIGAAIASDMAEFTRDRKPDSPRRPFRPEWLARGRFELVAVVNRIDRRRFDDGSCGEARLVYRLALKNPGRPGTRLPMTVNVRIPQPKENGGCRDVAARWLSGRGTTAVLANRGSYAIEINYQSIHVPASQKDMDDNAQYVLRAFESDGHGIHVRGLFNTPRDDLGPGEQKELFAWVESHLDEIDRGTAVLPERFLATRAVSLSPRGLLHAENRPFSRLLEPAREAVGRLPLGSLALANTPDLVLRRLDEMTCVGCHQTHAVAGFHLLGEERDGRSENALAVGHSPHLSADLAWRRLDLARAAAGESLLLRPFAGYPDGERGSDCGVTAGFASWSCKPGLVCRDLHHGDVGVCVQPEDAAPGSPCEDVRVSASAREEGALVAATPADATCPAPVGDQLSGAFCAPNWLGFTGGMCSERCSRIGETKGDAICAPLPSAGYEADCFRSSEPIESCLKRHFVSAYVGSCDKARSCRADYGCARVPNAPRGVGACVPPYFIFQARVDGPLLDR